MRFIVRGRIAPKTAGVTFRGFPVMQAKLNDTNTVVFRLAIDASEIVVSCEASDYESSSKSTYLTCVADFVRVAVDLFSFLYAMSLNFILETVQNPDGSIEDVVPTTLPFRQLIRSIKPGGGDFKSVAQLALTDPELALAINDLSMAISIPMQAEICCGRAMDAIRNMMNPKETGALKGWRRVQEELNITSGYLKMINGYSIAPRHGNRNRAEGAPVREILTKSWIVMDRFLQYRMHEVQALPLDKFPLLDAQ